MLVAEPPAFLRRLFTPRTVFMEVGGGDCALALSAAGYVERVYAVEPAHSPARRRLPGNFRLVRAEGVAQESVDVAYSARPALRATAELRRIHRSLAPAGVFLCPVDRQHGADALRAVFLEAGFRSVGLYAQLGPLHVRVPFGLRRFFPNARVAAQK